MGSKSENYCDKEKLINAKEANRVTDSQTYIAFPYLRFRTNILLNASGIGLAT